MIGEELWAFVGLSPARRTRDQAALGIGCLALVVFAIATVRLIASAWSTCAEIEAGGNFTLVYGYLPLTVAAMGLVAAATLRLSKSLRLSTRLILVCAAVVLTTLLIVVWSVPVSGYENWPGGSGDQASAQCGTGGIPTWWPAWLPS